MRLSQIARILESAPFERASLSVTGTQRGPQISNLNQFKAFVDAIAAIPAFKPKIDWLHNSWIFTTSQDSLVFPANDQTWSEANGAAAELLQSAIAMKTALKGIVIAENAESISVKISDGFDLQSISTTLYDLNKAFAQVIAEDPIKGELIVTGWETGSLWIVIYLKTIAALNLAGEITRSAFLLRQEKLRGDITAQQVHSYKLNNELIEKINEAVDAHLKILVENESRAIEDKAFSSHLPERQERIKESIRTLSSLVQRGVEIYPALQAPLESRSIFPDPKAIGTILSTIRQLDNITPGSAPELPESHSEVL